MTKEDYIRQSEVYFAQAKDELERQDLRQAAEKGWGAASQMVKAVAHSRGWDHHHHAELLNAVGFLVQETQNMSIQDGFNAAQALHQSFYEGGLHAIAVAHNLNQVDTFRQLIRQLAYE